jgi:hypothetical protein
MVILACGGARGTCRLLQGPYAISIAAVDVHLVRAGA